MPALFPSPLNARVMKSLYAVGVIEIGSIIITNNYMKIKNITASLLHVLSNADVIALFVC